MWHVTHYFAACSESTVKFCRRKLLYILQQKHAKKIQYLKIRTQIMIIIIYLNIKNIVLSNSRSLGCMRSRIVWKSLY